VATKVKDSGLSVSLRQIEWDVRIAMKDYAKFSVDLLSLSDEIVHICLDEASALKFDKGHPQQLYSICTHGSLIELSSSIVVLAKAGETICLPVIMRTVLDAFASFRCCVKDPNHFKSMYASFTKEKLRLVDASIVNPGNPYLAGLAASIHADSEKTGLAQQLAHLATNGHKPLKPWQEFEKADLSAEYQSLYWQLCLHAHNNVYALEGRHLEKTGDDYRVVFFKEANAEDLVRYLDSLCGVLLDSSISLHGLLGSGKVSVFEDLQSRLGLFRKSAGYA
jgi:hypothetical protein